MGCAHKRRLFRAAAIESARPESRSTGHRSLSDSAGTVSSFATAVTDHCRSAADVRISPRCELGAFAQVVPSISVRFLLLFRVDALVATVVYAALEPRLSVLEEPLTRTFPRPHLSAANCARRRAGDGGRRTCKAVSQRVCSVSIGHP